MQFDRRLLMVIGAVLLIVLIAYSSGFFGSGGEPEVAPSEETTQTQ